MSVADRPRAKLVLVRSALGRHLFAFVWLPRDEVSTGRRVAIGEMLAEASGAKLINWSIALEDGVVALLRYTLDLRGGGTMPDAAALDDRLERMVRGWLRIGCRRCIVTGRCGCVTIWLRFAPRSHGMRCVRDLRHCGGIASCSRSRPSVSR